MDRNLVFAYRYWQIMPDGVPPNRPWPEHNARDPPRPPPAWHPWGFSRPWHIWRSGRRISEEQVMPRQAFSLVWYQPTQQYWVGRPDSERWGEWEWSTLYCHHQEHSGRPGLWQLLDCADTRQHDSQCPEDFDEFLPKNFFTNDHPERPCHFFGHLSLILGLLAMCPENIDNIPKQIDEIFYSDDKPRFKPWYEHDPPGTPMDRYKHPGRAIVMQTGTIRNHTRSREDWLHNWEMGSTGPLVSSEDPTEEEKRIWRSSRY